MRASKLIVGAKPNALHSTLPAPHFAFSVGVQRSSIICCMPFLTFFLIINLSRSHVLCPLLSIPLFFWVSQSISMHALNRITYFSPTHCLSWCHFCLVRSESLLDHFSPPHPFLGQQSRCCGRPGHIRIRARHQYATCLCTAATNVIYLLYTMSMDTIRCLGTTINPVPPTSLHSAHARA
jgi:hypothetical protein